MLLQDREGARLSRFSVLRGKRGRARLARKRVAAFVIRPGGRRGGFTLTEILVVIGLLGVFGLVSARLFTSSTRALWAARVAETQVHSMENAMGRMRADVWGATGVKVDAAGVLVVSAGDGAVVTWTASAGGVLTRSAVAGGVTRGASWAAVGKGMTFAVADGGPVVVVRVPDGKGWAEFAMVRQVALAALPAGGGR